MINNKSTHRCNTDNPQRPCCWAARNAELDAMKARRLEREAAKAARTPEQIAADNAAAAEREASVWRN